jgi:hypothetical protein
MGKENIMVCPSPFTSWCGASTSRAQHFRHSYSNEKVSKMLWIMALSEGQKAKDEGQEGHLFASRGGDGGVEGHERLYLRNCITLTYFFSYKPAAIALCDISRFSKPGDWMEKWEYNSFADFFFFSDVWNQVF